MYRVVILQKSLPQYREVFFTQLKNKLAENNISLELIYGGMNEGRRDGVDIDWATYQENKYYNLGSLKLIWQPCLKQIKSSDLIIVEQADKLLINYILFFRKFFGKQKFAFWGHGINRQLKKGTPKNLFKRIFLKHASWWFAYTPGIKSFLIENGYPQDKITVVENAIDTKQMIEDYNSISKVELNSFREKYQLGSEEKLLIYCGALYKEKRIEFLIAAADRLIEMGHKIKLAIVGSGPDEYLITQALTTRSYILFLGPLFGREKAKVFRSSEMFLLPGAIGLAVLDSFAFETPLVTIQSPFHGPEFEYLINEFNGVVTENNMEAYTKSISDLLNNEEKLKQIKKNCKLEAVKLNIVSVTQFDVLMERVISRHSAADKRPLIQIGAAPD